MIYIAQEIKTLTYINIDPPDSNLIDLHSSTETIWNETVATEPTDNALIVRFDNHDYTSIGVGRTNAESITINVYNSTGKLAWTVTYGNKGRYTVDNWYKYYTTSVILEPIEKEMTGYIKMPAYPAPSLKNWYEYYNGSSYYDIDGTGYIEVIFAKSGLCDDVRAGYLVAGREFYIGDTLYGVAQTLISNEVKDDLGVILWSETYDEFKADLKLPEYSAVEINRKMKSTLGSVVFTAEPNADFWNSFAVFGKIEDFSTTYRNRMGVFATITLKEEL